MRYWLYEKSKVSGPYDIEELRKMGFSRETALFCGEQSRGESPGDWRKALEIEELRDMPPSPEHSAGEEKEVKERRILELEDNLLALKREIKFFQERDKVREHRQGQELDAAKEQLGQYAETVKKLSSEIKSAEAKSAEQSRTILQLRQEKLELESRLDAGTGLTEAKLKLKEEELQNTRFKTQELENIIPPAGDEPVAPGSDSAEAPEMAEPPSRPWGKVILVVAGISAILLSGRWYLKRPALPGTGEPAISGAATLLSIPPTAEMTARSTQIPANKKSAPAASKNTPPKAANIAQSPSQKAPAAPPAAAPQAQPGPRSTAQGAASPPQSTPPPPAKFFPEGKRLLLPGLEKPVKVEVSSAAPRDAPLELPSSLGSAQGQAHPGPRPPAGGKGRLEPQSGVSSTAEGAAAAVPELSDGDVSGAAQESDTPAEDSDPPLIDGEDQ
ncbi:MAG: hypothetical protein HY611_05975 [Elusimicrobia bacterium]|nr:hypothetical protein [Elusimicrobiota bacterium]